MCGCDKGEPVSLSECSKGLRSGRNVFERVGSNPTADTFFAIRWHRCLLVLFMPTKHPETITAVFCRRRTTHKCSRLLADYVVWLLPSSLSLLPNGLDSYIFRQVNNQLQERTRSSLLWVRFFWLRCICGSVNMWPDLDSKVLINYVSSTARPWAHRLV